MIFHNKTLWQNAMIIIQIINLRWLFRNPVMIMANALKWSRERVVLIEFTSIFIKTLDCDKPGLMYRKFNCKLRIFFNKSFASHGIHQIAEIVCVSLVSRYIYIYVHCTIHIYHNTKKWTWRKHQPLLLRTKIQF